MKKYAQIQDNKISKLINISDNDTVIVPKLLAHGYLIVEEQVIPDFDSITQTLTDSYEIQEDKVMRIWTITERPFLEAQQAKKDTVEMKALDEIKLAFEGGNQEENINKALTDKSIADAKIEAAKTNDDLRSVKAKSSEEMK